MCACVFDWAYSLVHLYGPLVGYLMVFLDPDLIVVNPEEKGWCFFPFLGSRNLLGLGVYVV